MKKAILIIFLMASMLTKGQEFSFRMYFEDSVGNQDSLSIGIDLTGSRDSILSQFNEINILETPYNLELDVRITNQADINMGNTNHSLYHTKNKTIRYYCPFDGFWFIENPFVNIDIYTENWPVTVSWDQDAFQEDSLSGSLFTPMHPRSWWDAGSYYSNFEKILMKDENQHPFTSNYPSNWTDYPNDFDNGNYYTIDGMDNPISTFWFAFGNHDLISLQSDYLKREPDIILYPNPTNNRLFLTDNSSHHNVEHVFAFDNSGKRFDLLFDENGIDLQHLGSGLYLIQFVYSDGRILAKKIIKK
jgi:hypothetical protein